MIQGSPIIKITNVLIDHDISTTYTKQHQFSNSDGVFTGLAIPLLNGESAHFDCYAYEPGFGPGGFVNPNTPNILPVLMARPGRNIKFREGDAPNSTLVENYGVSGSINMLDSPDWPLVICQLQPNVMSGQTFPEQNPTVPLPTTPPASELHNLIIGHELGHVTQLLTSGIFSLDYESRSTAYEQEPKLNNNTVFTFRPIYWSNYMASVVRGRWALCLPDQPSFDATLTYGASFFWRYLAMQFDFNYQITRRTQDILSTQSLGALLKAIDFPPLIYLSLLNTFSRNPAGHVLALKQALSELFVRDLKEIYTDFAISLALLRNNTSIPMKYRHNYPYWLASPSYPGYLTVAAGVEPWASWWQEMQDNFVIPEGYIFTPFFAIGPDDYAGQTFIPTLTLTDVSHQVQDMCMIVYQIPKPRTQVTVNVQLGEWRISVIQFTSDNTPVGIFKIDGPHVNNGGSTVINLAQFTDAGYIRLVCAHVSINDYGGLNNFYQASPHLTGKIAISSSST